MTSLAVGRKRNTTKRFFLHTSGSFCGYSNTSGSYEDMLSQRYALCVHKMTAVLVLAAFLAQMGEGETRIVV